MSDQPAPSPLHWLTLDGEALGHYPDDVREAVEKLMSFAGELAADQKPTRQAVADTATRAAHAAETFGPFSACGAIFGVTHGGGKQAHVSHPGHHFVLVWGDGALDAITNLP